MNPNKCVQSVELIIFLSHKEYGGNASDLNDSIKIAYNCETFH
jgi:hypothetical protein